MGGEAFSFDSRAKRRLVPDQTLLAALREFVRLWRGRGCTQKAWHAWPKRPCSALAVRRRYGTWSAALRRAGVQWPRCQTYGPDELIRRLEWVWKFCGYPPGSKAIRRHGRVSSVPYIDHWGSLDRARKQLERHKAGLITREELLRKTGRGPRPPVPAGLRYTVFKRDGFRCVICGADPKDDPGVKLVCDHKHPHARGGPPTLENLQCICERCNQGKSDSV